jgi:hypothetical protein
MISVADRGSCRALPYRITHQLGTKEKRSALRRSVSLQLGSARNYWQAITPVLLSQTTFVKECDAVAVQVTGGPAFVAAVTVTLFEGLKPWSEFGEATVPPKYWPFESAAYCSS